MLLLILPFVCWSCQKEVASGIFWGQAGSVVATPACCAHKNSSHLCSFLVPAAQPSLCSSAASQLLAQRSNMTSLCTCAPSFRLILRMATEHIPTLLPSPKCHNTHVCVCGRRGRITELCLPSSSLTASEVHSPGFILQGKRFLRILSVVFPPASLKWFCHPLQMPIGMMHTSGRLRPEAKQRKLDKPQALSQLVYEDVVEGFLARISDSSSLQGDSTQSLHTSL